MATTYQVEHTGDLLGRPITLPWVANGTLFCGDVLRVNERLFARTIVWPRARDDGRLIIVGRMKRAPLVRSVHNCKLERTLS